uniref:ADP-ribosyl cyclase/cyclic ADP-ribose hydrolase n=1 Tax=Chaetoceros debilis TaxID=122233 RepID=A0A7S3V460_9STRA|mmetsp:Transcript_13570/g.20195  ORF Transcript_13570/g.20195 Transcript_13570/m.20195 type:complete len:329 (+) Transcript_13570:213-1199(+)
MKLQTISAFLLGLALQNQFNAVAGVDEVDRHKIQPIVRDEDDTGAINQFACTLKDGKFMDTVGTHVEKAIVWEAWLDGSRELDSIIWDLKNYFGEEIIKGLYTDKGCGERRMLRNKESSSAAKYVDWIAGFDMTNPSNIGYGECTSSPSAGLTCEKRLDGMTLYFKDNMRRALNSDTDFSAEESVEDIVVEEILSILQVAIDNISLDDFNGLAKLSFVEIPPEIAVAALEESKTGDTRGKSDGNNGYILPVFLALAVTCSVVGAATYKYRQRRNEKNMAREQEDIDAEDQLLKETYEPTAKIESMRPLATDHAVVEIIMEEVDLNSKA